MSDTATGLIADTKSATDAVERFNSQLWRRVSIALTATLAITIGALVYVSIAVGNIEGGQRHNTQVSTRREKCQVRAMNDVLHDINLVVMGNRNRADYVIHVMCR